MTSEETNPIRGLVRKAPRTIWGYWPFLFPVLIALASLLANIALAIYWKSQMPELEVLFRRGAKVEPVWNSQLVREVVMIAALSITITFVMFAFLARIAFRQLCLLRAAARDLGIEDEQERGSGE